MFDLPDSKLRRVALFGLSLFSILGGLNHFLNAQFYIDMMPSYLPAPRALVAISGLFEIAGGLGILHPRTRKPAGWGLIALLIAVFPANLNMALNADQFAATSPRWALYARLPIQILFIAWVYYAAIRQPKNETAADSTRRSSPI